MFKKALITMAVLGLISLAASSAFARDHGRPGPHHGHHGGMYHGPMHHHPHFGPPPGVWHTRPFQPYRPPYTYRRPLYYHPMPGYYAYPGFSFGYSRPGVSLYLGW
ncbi:MAG: hypothetical protein JW829_05100 [Pirellulales bacterium]|nr:hypothetical protein [Pirellulales bacterium]